MPGVGQLIFSPPPSKRQQTDEEGSWHEQRPYRSAERKQHTARPKAQVVKGVFRAGRAGDLVGWQVLPGGDQGQGEGGPFQVSREVRSCRLHCEEHAQPN